MTQLGVGANTSSEVNGYRRVDGFLSLAECRVVLAAAEGMLERTGDWVVRCENNLAEDLPMRRRVSKLYRFHRHEPFRSLCTTSRLLSHVSPVIGDDVDVFLSQVVWKVPGALGQPWHQDSAIFPFEPSRPVVAAWIALTDATEANSCLRVIPGSHAEEVSSHGFDRRSPTGGRYLALADQGVVNYEPLVMAAGDLVVFDSHLIHSSGDNTTDAARVALCFHFATAGTIDRTAERFGLSPFNDWMPALRSTAPEA